MRIPGKHSFVLTLVKKVYAWSTPFNLKVTFPSFSFIYNLFVEEHCVFDLQGKGNKYVKTDFLFRKNGNIIYIVNLCIVYLESVTTMHWCHLAQLCLKIMTPLTFFY